MAEPELAKMLARRQAINEYTISPENERVCSFNPYKEFAEFSRKEIKEYEKMFKKFDVGGDNYIDFHDLKRMMEKLGSPQTHLALKDMIREIDEDQDNRINFREFLLIFRKARAGELSVDSGLLEFAHLAEIDVEKVGVGGAKTFFEAQIEKQKRNKVFEEEIKVEREERRRGEEERRQRKAAFLDKAQFFQETAA
ncbi:EF-hand domain-containing protein D2-like isoform X1 [Limulus polyphemus]|uniref:EF-hand domain-containing protein D2-like isoform X1 n=1 Tax=Limulus polyphemus TaxID=6850 RepID=A0ABM1BJ45_LIMPO|nr:EF-hand domain-containing protein D2-like isoform X1 [Limulus polyphemus]